MIYCAQIAIEKLIIDIKKEHIMEARLASPGDAIYLVESTRHGWDHLISRGTFIEYKGLCQGDHYEICVIHRDGLFQKNKLQNWPAMLRQ